MKRLGGLAKGAGKEAVKIALNSAVEEIVKETGVKDLAKEKIIEAGKKIIGDESIPNKDKIEKEILKTLIKRELGL
ncbi:hypothetical protein [Candidatus Hodarchaeum mangrovi]